MRASRSRRAIDGRIAAAKIAVGEHCSCAPIRARTWRVSSRTSVRECTSMFATVIGAPKVTNARER